MKTKLKQQKQINVAKKQGVSVPMKLAKPVATKHLAKKVFWDVFK